jgi:membrane fusion protein, multidrug efflux system
VGDQRSEIYVPTRPMEADPGVAAAYSEDHWGAPPGEVAPGRVRRSRVRLILWWTVALVVAATAIWVIPRPGNGPHRGGGRMATTGPVPVEVAPVEKGDMPISLSQIGSVTPLATVTVKTQINGYLTQVAFQEGQTVNKGDFLAQIDPRPYQVALAQAEGRLAKDQALLKNAVLDLGRYKTLLAQNSIAKQTHDTQASLLAQLQATVKSDQAQIDAQKLNLLYCHIVSPVTGRLGLRQVDPGNYVQTSDPNGIVVVTLLQPISVIFTLPGDNLAKVMKQVRTGAKLQVTAYNRAGTVELGKGTLETVDNQIDTTTGTVKLRAIFDNQQEILFPNQFVNVQLLVDTMHDVEIVPTAAIQRGAPGTFVYLVKPDHTVAAQPVKLGPTNHQHTAILAGLRPGESVVVDGVDRLRDGAKIALATSADGNVEAPLPEHPKEQRRLGRGEGGGGGHGQGGGQGSGQGDGKGGGRQRSSE